MKIGIISDAHFFNRYAITPKIYSRCLREMENMNVDIIVDCGDLLDKSNITAPQIDELISAFNNLDVPVYILAGNHDSLSDKSVISALKNNTMVKIIQGTKPYGISDTLFIPYTDDIKQLYKDLDATCTKQYKFAFSHLNMTNNIYATLPFEKASAKLHKYADVIFNGHIHEPEKYEDVYGKIYNVGACSSLTFGDNHIPIYSIYNSKTEELNYYYIQNTIVHRTYDAEALSDAKTDIQDLIGQCFKVSARFKLPNSDEGLELRKKVKSEINDLTYNDFIHSIYFEYKKQKVKDNSKSKQQSQQQNKKPLIEQLFDNFEKDNDIKLIKEIKEELLIQ